MANLVRVIYRENGEIAIQRDMKRADAICEKLKATHPLFTNCTWEDIDEADLPVRDLDTRDKWRKKAGGGVEIDLSVVTPREARAVDMAALQAERDKPTPNLKAALDLMLKLQENNY